MLSNRKMLYQVKLILDYLPEEEYRLIPQDMINYIENNYEYDENIKINPKIPLEKQSIDDKTYEMLNKIEKRTFNNTKDIDNYIEKVKKENKEFNIKIENAKLKNKLEVLEKENERIPKAKALLEEYNSALKQKETEIKRLKEKNQKLNNYIKKIPKILRNIFTKEDDIKILINEE